MAADYEYSQLEGGIHRFVFLRANRAAVDRLLQDMERVFTEAPRDQPLLLLVDLRVSGLPPINYAFPALRRFFEEYETPEQIRSAYLFSSQVMVSLLQTFLDALRLPVTRRTFGPDDEQEAIAWLRAEGEQISRAATGQDREI